MVRARERFPSLPPPTHMRARPGTFILFFVHLPPHLLKKMNEDPQKISWTSDPCRVIIQYPPPRSAAALCMRRRRRRAKAPTCLCITVTDIPSPSPPKKKKPLPLLTNNRSFISGAHQQVAEETLPAFEAGL